MYGAVTIRLKDRKIVDGELLGFTTIPIPEVGIVIYGIVETFDGRFLARQLSEIKRAKTKMHKEST